MKQKDTHSWFIRSLLAGGWEMSRMKNHRMMVLPLFYIRAWVALIILPQPYRT